MKLIYGLLLIAAGVWPYEMGLLGVACIAAGLVAIATVSGRDF